MSQYSNIMLQLRVVRTHHAFIVCRPCCILLTNNKLDQFSNNHYRLSLYIPVWNMDYNTYFRQRYYNRGAMVQRGRSQPNVNASCFNLCQSWTKAWKRNLESGIFDTNCSCTQQTWQKARFTTCFCFMYWLGDASKFTRYLWC